jgi:hypothetical protein
LTEYHITDAALAKLKAEYMPLTVKDGNDKEGGMIARNFNGQLVAALKYLKEEAEAL